MKDAWNELGTTYEASPAVLIGDVDCTVEQSLCETHGVRGYPTIKYWIADEGREPKDYNGGRESADLQKFAADTLDKPMCFIDKIDGCTAKEQDFYNKNKDKSADELAKALERLEAMKGGKMKKDLKVWVAQRINILKQLASK